MLESNTGRGRPCADGKTIKGEEWRHTGENGNRHVRLPTRAKKKEKTIGRREGEGATQGKASKWGRAEEGVPNLGSRFAGEQYRGEGEKSTKGSRRSKKPESISHSAEHVFKELVPWVGLNVKEKNTGETARAWPGGGRIKGRQW